MIFVSSACLKEKNIKSIIEKLINQKISNIELSGGTKFYDGIENDLIQLKKENKLQFACHAYFPPPKEDFVVNLASCNDEIYWKSINYYINGIKFLKRLGCLTLSLHAGFYVEIGIDEIGKAVSSNIIVYEKEEAVERFCSAYEKIAYCAKKENITVFLENNVLTKQNLKRFGNKNLLMMTDFASILEMRKKIDFNFLLDLAHLHVTSHTLKLDFEKEVQNLNNLAAWFHISENNGIIDQHFPLVDQSPILQQFRKIKIGNRNITLETVGELTDIIKSYKLIESLEY